MSDIKKNMNKPELLEKALEKEKELEEQKKANKELQGKVNKLEEMMQQLLFKTSMNQQPTVIQNEDADIYVGTVKFGELPINLDGKQYRLMGGKGCAPFTKEETNSLVKHIKYRDLFINGLLYFEDEANYEKFRVNPLIRFDEKSLDELMSKETDEIISILKNAIAGSERVDMLMHTITYKIAELQIKGKLVDINKINSIVEALGIKTPTIIAKQYQYMTEQKFW